MTDEIIVSVLCTAYNHEKYIRHCLDGFVMQKTNFRYEVLINDDASTDNTAVRRRINFQRKYESRVRFFFREQAENTLRSARAMITGLTH